MAKASPGAFDVRAAAQPYDRRHDARCVAGHGLFGAMASDRADRGLGKVRSSARPDHAARVHPGFRPIAAHGSGAGNHAVIWRKSCIKSCGHHAWVPDDHDSIILGEI